ncbi:MAG TPA: hypothetical protein VN851_13045, partial [Thermoanaerobaculia bacterium]|nr:hypothetical protein [Thermoanaerobaculia bacterium]
IVFRVGHGNLIQAGSERVPPPDVEAPPVRVTRAAAYAKLSGYVGGFVAGTDTLLDRGSLHLLPVALRDDRLADGFVFAHGYGLTTVWEISFRRAGVRGTWRGRIDATTGEVVEFVDTELDAQATGGVAADNLSGKEAIRPMPYVDLGDGSFANSAGLFPFGGTPLTSTLTGKYASVNDLCGSVSLGTDASGNLPFGTSPANNCATPPLGGPGNTRSSRTGYYSVNRGKEIARGWLPGISWLNGSFVISVNNTGACNGNWTGTGIRLFRAVAGSCGASGEEPGFVLHEYGHGLDQNDGTGITSSSSEAYADVIAALALHNSCVGPGFRLVNCPSYGDPCTACTGLRDIDWAKHSTNTPHTVANYTQAHCIVTGAGPCGHEVHCESHVATEAVWDFANRDLPDPGSSTAWNVAERLWYLSRPTSTAAFTCTTGGTFSSNGCNVGSWFKTLRAVDDDDGNLANGTPHSCALFAAFNRHGIACPTDAGADICSRGCTQPPVPALALFDGNNSTDLSWSDSGAGNVYDVYRNELGCKAGFAKIADDVAATSLTDTSVADGVTYFYQVVAHPAGNEACHAAPSGCLATTKDAQLLGLSVPTTMVPGRRYTVNVTVKNTGEISWNSLGPVCNAYRLAQVGNAAWSPIRIELSAPIAPNASANLSFQVTAPGAPGTYDFQLRMVHECVEFFGAASPLVRIKVGD